MANIELHSNAKEIQRKIETATEKALTMIGGVAESAAKQKLTDNGSVDTGLLRNSITYAISGKYPATQSYATNTSGRRKDGKPIEKVEGHYTQTAPEPDNRNELTVFVGTNVEYAPVVELGSSERKRKGKPYLRPAMEENRDKFKRAIELAFKSL